MIIWENSFLPSLYLRVEKYGELGRAAGLHFHDEAEGAHLSYALLVLSVGEG
jgi:hypothetical protein